MKHRRAPRGAAGAIGALAQSLAPATLLADVQRVWPEAAGPVIAAQATPTAARAGKVTISASSAVWAQELDLMATELVARLNERLGEGVVTAVKVQAAPSVAWAREET